jgi:DNA polymerase III sliding clamp (beta) subunit (PCNA family)
MTVGVNPEFLAEALAAMRSSVVEISISHPKRPLLLVAVDEAGDSYRHTLVPIVLK